MRWIKNKEHRLAGHIYCDHCKPKKVDALWRKEGITASHARGDFACEAHKHLIKEDHDDGHMTEADYETWGRV
jgi:hypothetical protein